MEKPKITNSVRIHSTNPEARLIVFYAPPDALEDFKAFGGLGQHISIPDMQVLTVAGGYDFSAVVRYMEDYQRQETDTP